MNHRQERGTPMETLPATAHADTVYLIEGPCRLTGSVPVSGAKNAALPLLAATLLTGEECVLRHCPRIADVALALALLEGLGKTGAWEADGLHIREGVLRPQALGPEAAQMRASVLFLGPLLARFGKAATHPPGGCAIGKRPIDLHLAVFRALGAQVEESETAVVCQTSHLAGARIRLPFPSVGTTENALLAAVLARGVTVLEGAAREPEVADLAAFLQRMGARITGAGTGTLRIEGVPALRGAVHTILPDRIEAATFLAAGAITGGNVFVEHAKSAHLEAFLGFLRQTGCSLDPQPGGIALAAPARLRPASVITGPYPQFPTDAQPFALALLTLAEGTGMIRESMFENRFRQAAGLSAMGARIAMAGQTARVTGVPALTGAAVAAADLRGGASLILAALAARGQSRITGGRFVERGYEALPQKLTRLGACIQTLPLSE